MKFNYNSSTYLGQSWIIIGVEEDGSEYPTLLVLDPHISPEHVRFRQQQVNTCLCVLVKFFSCSCS